jgi:hypothetical protein
MCSVCTSPLRASEVNDRLGIATRVVQLTPMTVAKTEVVSRIPEGNDI